MTAYRLFATAFKLRAVLLLPVLVVICLCTRGEYENDLVLWPLGLLIYLPGVVVRVWSQSHLKYRLSGARALAMDGPYAHVRNPVYLANIAILAGLTVLCELLWMVPFVVAWATVVYALAVRFEEIRLRKRCGALYMDYCARVPRWLPQFAALKNHTHATQVALARAAGVEWHTTLFLVFPVAKELLCH